MKESEVWQKTRHETWGHLGRAILSHWKLFLYLVVLMTAMNLASHGTQDLYPTFLERQWGFDVGQRNLLSAFTMVGAIIGGTLCGLISDRFGRRRTICCALLGAVLVIPLWAFAPTVPLLFAGGFLMQFAGAGRVGCDSRAPVGTVARFGARLPAGLRLSDGRAALELRHLVRGHRSPSRRATRPPCRLTALVVFLAAALATALGPEKHAVKFGDGNS